MKVGVVQERLPGEHRVALVPASVATLRQRGLEVRVQAGAGLAAGFEDAAYREAGAGIAAAREAVFESSDVLLQVRSGGADLEGLEADLPLLGASHVVIALLEPLFAPAGVARLAERGVTAFALELMPRVTRAQPMDVLSSMSNLAGYKAVLLAAAHAPRIFPLMMTAAGTLAPARVLVLGAGVAGLQAIATAKRLGAVVEAYDVRAEVRDQVQSVGGKFIDLELDTRGLADTSGYAKAQSADFLAEQRRRLATYLRETDVVITTAAIPGRRAPVLITAAMQHGMKRGAVIVDLAADTGGNCELARPGEEREADGVTIIAPLNLPASIPFHASQLFAKNISSFLLHLVGKEGRLVTEVDGTDEIAHDTLVARGGKVVHARVQAALEAAG